MEREEEDMGGLSPLLADGCSSLPIFRDDDDDDDDSVGVLLPLLPP